MQLPDLALWPVSLGVTDTQDVAIRSCAARVSQSELCVWTQVTFLTCCATTIIFKHWSGPTSMEASAASAWEDSTSYWCQVGREGGCAAVSPDCTVPMPVTGKLQAGASANSTVLITMSPG
jgi:hypothetical protein